MITQIHLEHWISEISYALNGLESEAGKQKLKGKTGIRVAVSSNTNEDVHVSFEYIQEKITTIKGLISCIGTDIKND